MTTAAIGESYEFVVAVPPQPARLDAWLAAQPDLAAQGLSRSRLHKLAGDGRIAVNGVPARPAQRIRPQDIISVAVPPPQLPDDLRPQDLPITVAYEDDHIVVVDKPAGLPVHPGPGHPDGTLVNALLALCPNLRGIGGKLRPGIVHRLDRDTSGLLVAAKNQPAHRSLTDQLKNRAVLKEYCAVAVGIVTPASGAIDAPIARHPYHRQKMAVASDSGARSGASAGRPARTHYRTIAAHNGHTLLAVRLETGRTHQIRVHLAHLRFPVLGDGVYGRPSALVERQFLHAARLGFRHPATGEWSEYSSALPPDLAAAWARLQNG